MTTAKYRGVEYNVEERKEQLVSNWLPIIQKQIEKQNKLKQAQLAMAMKQWYNILSFRVNRSTTVLFKVHFLFRKVYFFVFECVIISIVCHVAMDKERLKLIVKNLKLLVQSLESEIYSDVGAYKAGPIASKSYSSGDDDDGYPD